MDQRSLAEFVARTRELRRRDELDAATIEVLTAFDSIGVKALLLKGPALAHRLYAPAGESRGYWDIDLLVPPHGLESAREALATLGYTKAEEVFGVDDVGGVQHGELWARQDERGGPLCIDLHFRLSGCKASREVVWDSLAKGHNSIDLQGRPVAVPGDDGLALHLALHAAQHGSGDTKAIGDLERGIERWPLAVWRSAALLAEAVQGVPAFAAGLRLVPASSRLASRLDLPATPQLEWEILHRDARPRGTFHLEAIAGAGGLRERISVLRRSLLPDPQWIRWEFPWARTWLLLLVGYACHIVRAPVWAAQAMRFRRRARRP